MAVIQVFCMILLFFVESSSDSCSNGIINDQIYTGSYLFRKVLKRLSYQPLCQIESTFMAYLIQYFCNSLPFRTSSFKSLKVNIN